ncbi:MAG: hypothetical protein FWD19_01355, partial [Defluviitaleaceae bacterium]|nr:hypothetical protein [Defluviitaleaceae bacterium]
MKTNKTRYVCSDCGHSQGKWLGRCPACNLYNTFEELEIAPKLPGGAAAAAAAGCAGADVGELNAQMKRRLENSQNSHKGAQLLADVSLNSGAANRSPTGISELDRVLGGG